MEEQFQLFSIWKNSSDVFMTSQVARFHEQTTSLSLT